MDRRHPDDPGGVDYPDAMTSTAGQTRPDRAVIAHRIDLATRAALHRTLEELGPSPLLEPLVEAAFAAVDGGKRLRGSFALIGAALADGHDPADGDLDALAAALELYQASALAHDDLVDHSDTRRGRPTPHVALASSHRASGWRGSAQDYGAAAAVLLGDLLLSAADHTVAVAAGALPPGRGSELLARFTLMHAEVALGQFLDVRAEQVPLDVDDDDAIPLGPALEVVRRKSARYSVVHPLALGVIAAGGGPDLVATVERVAGPWGTAFQLRDDDLGVFGDVSATGKPTGSDLLEGKRTPLLALTWERAPRAARAELAAGLGHTDTTPELVSRMVGIVGQYGRGPHEEMIDDLVSRGARELADSGLDARASALLAGLGDLLTHREA